MSIDSSALLLVCPQMVAFAAAHVPNYFEDRIITGYVVDFKQLPAMNREENVFLGQRNRGDLARFGGHRHLPGDF